MPLLPPLYKTFHFTHFLCCSQSVLFTAFLHLCATYPLYAILMPFMCSKCRKDIDFNGNWISLALSPGKRVTAIFFTSTENQCHKVECSNKNDVTTKPGCIPNYVRLFCHDYSRTEAFLLPCMQQAKNPG